jgi:hypothetical protein
MARTPKGAAELQEPDKRGDPRRHRRGVSAGTKHQLLDGGVAQAQVTGDLSQWTRLDRPLPERVPLTDAQLLEDGTDEIAFDHCGFWVGVATGIGSGTRRDRLDAVVAPQQVETVILRGGEEPRTHWFSGGSPANGLGRFEEHLLGGVGRILWVA